VGHFDDFPKSPFRVAYDGKFKLKDAYTEPPKGSPDKDACEARLAELQDDLRKLQDRLYASDNHSILLIFQAMDAAGKDGTVRAVMSGVNPAGCQVYSFKQPSSEELDHDFLWRAVRALPERGRIGIFNRSYYEETLVVRVHPEYLADEKLPYLPKDLDDLWEERFESIRAFEKHLWRQGTVILKFWLNVSRKEQKERFLERIDAQEKNWKFSSGDIKERGRWDDYMEAFEEALAETSRPWAPWYAIPADDKAYMRLAVAEVIVKTLKNLGLEYPELTKDELTKLDEMRRYLEAEGDGDGKSKKNGKSEKNGKKGKKGKKGKDEVEIKAKGKPVPQPAARDEEE
jgi:PPK2 family polyphosphate:nucleotide phosphotransferase